MTKVVPYMQLIKRRVGITCRFAVYSGHYLRHKDLLNVYIENGGHITLSNWHYENAKLKNEITKEEIELQLAKKVYGTRNQVDLPIEAFEILRNIEWG